MKILTPSKRKRGGAGCPGMTLIELLTVLVLLGAFMTIATPLFIAVITTMRDAHRSYALVMRFDSAMGQLRRDMWSSRSFAVADAQRLILTQPDATTITYTFDETGGLQRITSANLQDVRHWPALPRPMTFAQQGPLLAITVPASAAFSTATPPVQGVADVVLIPSRLQLVNGGGQ